MTFWTEINAQLDRIEAEKPDTFNGVRRVLLDPECGEVTRDVNLNGARSFGPNKAFFAGSGGDRSLLSALQVAGWQVIWAEAHYYYVVRHVGTGETLTYCEGDVLRGDAR